MPEQCALSHGSGVLGRDPRDSCRFWSPHVEKVCTGGGGYHWGGGSANREPGSYIYIYIYIYIYCVCVCVHVYLHICVHICMYGCMHVFTSLYIYIYIYMYVQTSCSGHQALRGRTSSCGFGRIVWDRSATVNSRKTKQALSVSRAVGFGFRLTKPSKPKHIEI